MHGVHQEPFSFPVEIVVMSDAGNAALHDRFHDRQAEWRVHWYRHTVFSDEQVQFESLDRCVKFLLDDPPHLVNFSRHIGISVGKTEALAVDPFDGRMLEMGFRDDH